MLHQNMSHHPDGTIDEAESLPLSRSCPALLAIHYSTRFSHQHSPLVSNLLHPAPFPSLALLHGLAPLASADAYPSSLLLPLPLPLIPPLLPHLVLLHGLAHVRQCHPPVVEVSEILDVGQHIAAGEGRGEEADGGGESGRGT